VRVGPVVEKPFLQVVRKVFEQLVKLLPTKPGQHPGLNFGVFGPARDVPATATTPTARVTAAAAMIEDFIDSLLTVVVERFHLGSTRTLEELH